MMTTHTGGCMCQAIRFEITGEFLGSGACYCRECQYTCGGGPANAVVVQKWQMKLLKGQPHTHWTKSETGNPIGRSFCAVCGTPLFGMNESRPDYLPIMVGALDDPSEFRPMALSWVSSAQPWHRFDPELPKFDKNIPEPPAKG
ncbi:MAG: GFA family protein [Rhodospirillaceae bacterium]|nr:GFA family protein [Rhodospirillaceae bacterium]